MVVAAWGLINEGRRFSVSMTRDYGIIPQIEHYGCVVGLLNSVGLLHEAHEFIKPNGIVRGALLGGCRVHKICQKCQKKQSNIFLN